MMKYRIRGAYAANGQELSTTIEASTSAEAKAIAGNQGIFVSEVDPNDDDGQLPLRPGVKTKTGPVEPQFRFLRREAFAFGFYAGWGIFFVYVCARVIEGIFQLLTIAVQTR